MRYSKAICAVTISIGLIAGGCGGSSGASSSTSSTVAALARTTTAPVVRGVKPTVVVPPGPPPDHLVVEDLRKGEGPPVRLGHKLTVQFVGLRWNGEPFQSSWDGGKVAPFTFRLRNKPREVMPGWEHGIPGMREGGRRELIVPPQLVYRRDQHRAERFAHPETYVYVVEVLKVH